METIQQQKTTQKAAIGSRSSVSDAAISHPSRTIVHAKLEMTEPGDHDEQEADAMASAIMSGGKISRKISSGASGSSGIAVSRQMESQLSQLQGGGRPMPQGLQNMMESGFGQSFGQVRIHTDAEAAGMNSSIHAKAFTLGNDIYFNQGQFSPNTSEGQRLVAHELTHVVQGTGKVGRDTNNTDDETETTETKTEDNNTDSIPSPNLNRKERAEFLYQDNIKYKQGAIKGHRLFSTKNESLALIKSVDVPIWTEDENGCRAPGILSLKVHHKLIAMVKQIFTEVFDNSKNDSFIILITKIPPHPKKGEENKEKTQTAGWDYRYESKDYKPGDPRLESFSEHAGGVAIDINTSFNPFETYNKYDDPNVRRYRAYQNYVIKSDSILVKTFKKYGWKWGGEWKQDKKDFMHFEWFSQTYPKK